MIQKTDPDRVIAADIKLAVNALTMDQTLIDLQQEFSGILQIGGILVLDDIQGISFFENLQGKLETGIGPDLLIDISGRTLSRQNQMDAQTPTDP